MDASVLFSNQANKPSGALQALFGGQSQQLSETDGAFNALFAQFLNTGSLNAKDLQASFPAYQQDLIQSVSQDEQLSKFPSGFLTHLLPSLQDDLPSAQDLLINANAQDAPGQELDGAELQYQLLIQQEQVNETQVVPIEQELGTDLTGQTAVPTNTLLPDQVLAQAQNQTQTQSQTQSQTPNGNALQGQANLDTQSNLGQSQNGDKQPGGQSSGYKESLVETLKANTGQAKTPEAPQTQAQPQNTNAAPTAPIVQATASPNAQHAQFAAEITQASNASQPQTPHQSASADVAQQVGLQIAQKAQAGQNRFTIRLDPPELGRIDIRMTVSHDGTVQATLSADNEGTLDLLARDQRNLERALENAGLKTENGSLNFSLKQQGNGQFAKNGQDQPGAHGSGDDVNGEGEDGYDDLSPEVANTIMSSGRPLDITI